MRVAGRPLKEKMQALWFRADGLEFAALNSNAMLLIAAAILDFGLGDPWSWPHPVQLMGKAIDAYAQPLIEKAYSPVVMKLAGVGLAVLLIGGTAGLSAGLLALLAQVWSPLRWMVEAILLASCFAGRSLRHAAEDVLRSLPSVYTLEGDTSKEDVLDTDVPGIDASGPSAQRPAPLAQARRTLARYVGRDTEHLSAEEIRRAVLETVSENAVDGVLAPLFYAIAGSLVGMAAPVALAYKAASTLDSMVGYKEAPYTNLGWFSARLEDVLTWLPCRLSVLTIAVLSRRLLRVLRICWRDARADPSPNAGWSECAYAAALGVQLGGENTYRGQVKVKPLLGDADIPITERVISRAMMLTRWSFLVGLSAGVCTILLT